MCHSDFKYCFDSEASIVCVTLISNTFIGFSWNFLFPMPESGNEYELINDVNILGVRLQQAVIPFDTEMDKNIRTSSGAHGSLEVRIQKCQYRIKTLQKLLDASDF